MANRRMFSKDVVTTDAFLEMPLSARALYFHLGIEGDDDGFVSNPRTVIRLCGATNEDLTILIDNRFIIPFESGVIVIRHWHILNNLRNDRYHSTTCVKEKERLKLINNIYELVDEWDTNGIPMDNQTETEHNITPTEHNTTEHSTTPTQHRVAGGGGGDDGLSKLLNEFNKGLDDDAIRYVYDVVAVGEHITSRYAYARKILTDITNDREYFPPIFTVDQVKEFLSRRSQNPGNKPKKPMDSRTVTDEEMNGVYADIMNRPRSV